MLFPPWLLPDKYVVSCPSTWHLELHGSKADDLVPRGRERCHGRYQKHALYNREEQNADPEESRTPDEAIRDLEKAGIGAEPEKKHQRSY